ncbi:unnamed protein product [Prunus armeniaca]
MDESNIQMKSPHVENSCSLITKLNNSVCTNTSSYEETSPENCSVDHEADLKHSRENLLVSYILIAYFIHRDSLMHEEEQLHDEEKTGSDTLQQAGEVPECSKTMVVLIILQKYCQPMVVQVKGELIFRTAEGLLSSEQGVYIAESVAAKNIKEAEKRFRMPWYQSDHGGSNHSAKAEPTNGCTGERETGKSAKKPGELLLHLFFHWKFLPCLRASTMMLSIS